MSGVDYDTEQRQYDGTSCISTSRSPIFLATHTDDPVSDEARYDRDRSRSPRIDRRDDNGRARSASPDGRNRMDDEYARKLPRYFSNMKLNNFSERPPPQPVDDDDDPAAINPGSNLFVTGIHPRLSEDDVARLFEKYGTVKGCNVMRDPHTRESRGFGFVDMSSSEEADAAKNGLQGETIEGRTLSIEKARRSKPRTPTPGKYFGPPKRGLHPNLFPLVDHG